MMQAMLRGESLGMSEGVPALVEHQGGMMMIEPGTGQQPDSWAQDVPAAMRTPSLEARQVGAGFLLHAVCMHQACGLRHLSLFFHSLSACSFPEGVYRWPSKVRLHSSYPQAQLLCMPR